jgi:hypothetical protein
MQQVFEKPMAENWLPALIKKKKTMTRISRMASFSFL